MRGAFLKDLKKHDDGATRAHANYTGGAEVRQTDRQTGVRGAFFKGIKTYTRGRRAYRQTDRDRHTDRQTYRQG